VADSVNFTCDLTFPKFFGSAANMANGAMGNRRPCRINDIRDGTSNTLMAGEVTGAGPGTNRGNIWVSWGITDTSQGINSGLTVPGGGVWGTGTYQAVEICQNPFVSPMIRRQPRIPLC
jgi:hypothetical protein